VWFQCQAFPRNVLAVLGYFKGLLQLQIHSSTRPNFCPVYPAQKVSRARTIKS
jgi:hypothetical protein